MTASQVASSSLPDTDPPSPASSDRSFRRRRVNSCLLRCSDSTCASWAVEVSMSACRASRVCTLSSSASRKRSASTATCFRLASLWSYSSCTRCSSIWCCARVCRISVLSPASELSRALISPSAASRASRHSRSLSFLMASVRSKALICSSIDSRSLAASSSTALASSRFATRLAISSLSRIESMRESSSLHVPCSSSSLVLHTDRLRSDADRSFSTCACASLMYCCALASASCLTDERNLKASLRASTSLRR
mmetsp:Transcript_41547/g.101951  ORF Transcript_41547/g.101951 Transcript_41547/m.101951 type:complete len:253 (+) Transcript_41547:584-1342(+)